MSVHAVLDGTSDERTGLSVFTSSTLAATMRPPATGLSGEPPLGAGAVALVHDTATRRTDAARATERRMTHLPNSFADDIRLPSSVMDELRIDPREAARKVAAGEALLLDVVTTAAWETLSKVPRGALRIPPE